MDALTRDIGDHLTDRIRTVLRDTADTCDRAELDAAAGLDVLLSVMITETAHAARASRLSERDFLLACGMAYRAVGQKQRQRK